MLCAINIGGGVQAFSAVKRWMQLRRRPGRVEAEVGDERSVYVGEVDESRDGRH